MKKPFILITLLILSINVFAQKVDLDKFFFDVKYQKLPTEFVDADKRTYGVKANVSGNLRSRINSDDLYDRTKIWGWEKVENSPTVGVHINLTSFAYTRADAKSEIVENKDKNGKVTSKTTNYWYEIAFQGTGNYKIYGPALQKELTAKELEDKKKKEIAKTDNKFLENAVLENQTEANANSPTVIVSSGNLDQVYTHITEKRTDANSAREYYRKSSESVRADKEQDFINAAIADVNRKANNLYGFAPVENRDYLWILDSKNHAEYKTQQDAIQAVKVLFKEMKAERSIDILKTNLQPLINYFQSLKEKYKGSDKKDAKMRYSAYYNLAKIYYYLDEPNKAITEAEGLVRNDFDSGDGEDLKKMANDLIISLKRAKVNSRHNEFQNY